MAQGEPVDGWTVATLKEHIDQQLDDLRRQLTERYVTQTKALDAAFVAQQTAMQTAFAAADRAVSAALESAKEAVGKAEAASDKRFESVNEFRQQQADIIARFLTRAEYDAAHDALVDRVAAMDRSMTGRIGDLTSRLDTSQGTDLGAATEEANRRARFNQYIAILAVLVTFIAVVFAALKQ